MLSIADAHQTISGNCLKLPDTCLRLVVRIAPCDNCLRKRMLTFLFQRICGMHQIRFLTAYRKDIRYTRFTLRDRTSLIECNDLYLACLLQRNGRLKQDSMLCTHTISNHDGNRSCKSKCTRTADNQNGNRSCKRISYRSSYEHPDHKCHDCNADNDWYKYAGYFICDLRNRRFRCRCITYHMNDL